MSFFTVSSYFCSCGRLPLAVFWLASCLLAFSMPSLGQTSPVAVGGRVLDANAAAVAGATITLARSSGEVMRTTTTDENGDYRLEGLPPERYAVQASAPGFATATVQIDLQANARRDFDFTLQPEGANEVVTVSAGGDELTTDLTTAGTKVEMKLRDVPQSIQVVTRKLAEAKQAVTIADAVVRNVSGVTQVPTFFGNNDQFAIRGFALDVNNSYFRDGVKYNQLGFQETVDVEQTEVLKGPASVLYGRAEPGGIINLTSKSPLTNHYLAVNFQGGSFNFYRPTIDVSGPLNKSETLSYRFNGAYQDSDSFRDFVFRRRFYGAPKLLWKMSDATNVSFEASFMRDFGHPDYGVVGQDDRPVEAPLRTNFSEPWGRYKYQSRQGGYILNHVFSPNWSARQATRYTSYNWYFYDAFQSFFSDRDQLVRFAEDFDFPSRNFSSQLDVQGNFKLFGLQHKLLTGFEAARQITISQGKAAALPPINIFNFSYVAQDPPPSSRFINPSAPDFSDSYFTSNGRTIGAYVQDQITLHRTVKVLAGVRIDQFNQREFSDFPGFEADNRQTDIGVSPRIGAVYQPTENTSFYFSYSKSFSPSFPSQVQANNEPFRPSFGEQYEGGFKGDFFNRKISATASVYRIAKTNVIITDPNNPRNSIQVGSQVAKGAETDIAARPMRNMLVTFAYAFNQIFVANDTTFLIGSPLPNAARHNGSLSVYYDFRGGKFDGLSLTGGVSAQSRRQAATDTFDAATGTVGRGVRLPGFSRVDAGLSYRIKTKNERVSYKIAVTANNFLDRRYFESGNGNANIMVGAPRNYIASIQFQFK
jgi:iron complex outermembrane receptor protein